MKNITLIFILLSYSMSIFSLGMSFILYRKYKKRVILFFSLFMTGLTLDVLSMGIIRITEYPGVFHTIINLSAASLLTLGIPLFFLSLLGIQINTRLHILIALSFLFQNTMNLIYLLGGDTVIIREFLKIPLFLILFFTILTALVNYGKIGDLIIRKAIRALLLVIFIQLPVLVINEFNLFNSANNKEWIIFMISPLLNLILNGIIIIFTYNFFNQPYFFKDDKITQFFIRKFAITKREENILQIFIKGKSREEIAAELHISPHTVNNHIYNIYKKLAVKNKIQLLNLIQTNRD